MLRQSLRRTPVRSLLVAIPDSVKLTSLQVGLSAVTVDTDSIAIVTLRIADVRLPREHAPFELRKAEMVP